jgi:diguanylate cyclase (GGDEF)-like protein
MFLGQNLTQAGLRVTESSDPWTFLLRLNRILTAETTPDAMMGEILEALHGIREIEACWFGRPDRDGRICPVLAAGIADASLDYIRRQSSVADGPYSTGPSGRAWRSGNPEYVEDWRKDSTVAAWQAVTRDMNVQSSATIPLRGRAGPHSLLAIYSNSKGFFPDIWPLEVLTHLAGLIGNALENREKHGALRRAERLYQTLFNGAHHLLAAKSEAKLLRLLCKTLVESGLFVSCGVGRVEADGVHRHIAAAACRNAGALRRASYRFEADADMRPLTLDAWAAGKTLIANDYFSNPRFAVTYPLARKLGFCSITALIIRRGGAPWALMSVSAGTINYFDDELIKLLERMAGMVGHTLDELDLKAALRAEREAQRLIARQDALTLLPNRLAFQEQLHGSVARALRQRRNAGIGMIDLDDFKQVNDFWGHEAGDFVLLEVGRRIRGVLRESDFVARLGGDEFALILEDFVIDSEQFLQQVEMFCRRLQAAVSAPVTLPNGHVLNVSLSAGFTLFPLDDTAPDLLVRHADMALYAAKAVKGQAGAFWRLYQPGKDAQVYCRGLLRQGAVEVYFQPILNMEDEKIIGVEALARLRDGDALIPPRKFLPDLTLEDRCLLFRRVFEASVKQLELLDREGMSLTASVNVDAQVLLLDKTMPYLKKILAKTSIAPARLVLEILETHDFLDVKRATAQIKSVRALGMRVALDDLGAGYSSILKIRELPLDVVKLDRAFVAGLRTQPDDLMFISVIQTLTAVLGIKLIVEGVEEEDVLDALRMVGVRHVQGYVVAAPMAGTALAGWLRTYRPRRASQTPQTLLGAYALHTNWIRVLDFWRMHEPDLAQAHGSNRFSLNDFFAGRGSRHKAAREAYGMLQDVLGDGDADRKMILDAAVHFRAKLVAALKTEG